MSADSSTPSTRSDKAAATKAAILAAARRAFAAHGYDGVGLRAIAAEAGVTAMMVGRYFGSKEGLFGEVVADTMRDPVILAPENLAAADIPRAFAQALVGITGRETSPLDGFQILLRSTGSETAAQIARERIALAHQAAASGAVGADHPSERAAIFLALVAGFQSMRQMMGLDALAKADPAVLVDLLTPVLAEILKPAARG